ncbi:rodlin [Streptomyces sp. NPDC058989]|uniref:rodlin n=1 Tax=Streptomyces sp. NPDC058989 TaxID=3346686 RepID=UPI0036A47621
MIKKVLATTAVAASVVGISATTALQATAVGKHDGGTATVNGNGAKSAFGNSTTRGRMSPQLELVQGSLNSLCAALVGQKVNVGSLVGKDATTVQDINVLSNPQTQQCARNSTQAKGDEAVSHILNDIPILSGNGARHHKH